MPTVTVTLFQERQGAVIFIFSTIYSNEKIYIAFTYQTQFEKRETTCKATTGNYPIPLTMRLICWMAKPKLLAWKTRGEVGLQHLVEIHPLVEVIALDLGHVLWEFAAGLEDGFHGNRGDTVCHLFNKNKDV